MSEKNMQRLAWLEWSSESDCVTAVEKGLAWLEWSIDLKNFKFKRQ